MNRRRFLAAAGASGFAGLAGCGDNGDAPGGTGTGGSDGTGDGDGRLPFRVGATGFETAVADGYAALPVRGVNMGMAKPGRFPGEAAITREEYDRWLGWIGELGANVVRTYTIHPPAFYEALVAHNRAASDPVYLLQGTWIGEEELVETGDATDLSDAFDAELARTVDVVHGDATLQPRPGHASGTYEADASPWLLGYVAGIEWPPTVVIETNERGTGGSYEGAYVAAPDAPPFERWLAGRLDALVTRETTAYGTQRPVAFTNWVTTDPLEHPAEPFEYEDAVGVDPDALVATDAFEAGLFAAYHAYPYYPDFLNHEPAYVDYEDRNGEPNSYAGYLHDLVAATDHPLLVAEFGVPDSRGIAHRHVHGRDQGHHTEREQGEIVAAMFEDIVAAGAAGGVAFAWHDEWFKRTWNLTHRSAPHRRPFWSNVQTPEQSYGLLSFDPADAVRLAGHEDDWADATTVEPGGPPTTLGDGDDAGRTLVGVDVTHDAAALAVRLRFADLPDPVDWDALNAVVALGVTGRGNTSLPRGLDLASFPTDFLVRLGGPDDSSVRVDPYADPFAARFGAEAGLDLATYRTPNTGRFVPIRMAITRGYTVPSTGDEVPFEAVETGELRYGVGDPTAADYDSLADVHVAPAANAVEMRLPWGLINVADPSSGLRLADVWEGELGAFEPLDAITVAAATYAPDADGVARPVDGATNVTHAAPGVSNGRLRGATYAWERWDRPDYRERRKESYDVLKETFTAHRSAESE